MVKNSFQKVPLTSKGIYKVMESVPNVLFLEEQNLILYV